MEHSLSSSAPLLSSLNPKTTSAKRGLERFLALLFYFPYTYEQAEADGDIFP